MLMLTLQKYMRKQYIEGDGKGIRILGGLCCSILLNNFMNLQNRVRVKVVSALGCSLFI